MIQNHKYYNKIYEGDAFNVLRTLPDHSVQCCVTSPPYWGLRDYGVPGQIGLEPTPEQYVDCLTEVFAEVWRILRDDGTLWLNLGDSYIAYHGNNTARGSAAPSDKPGYRENMRPTSVGVGGLKNKNLAGIPWRVAFALQELGWYLRADIIWHKPNPMPESVRDRPTRAHEYVFLLSRSERYYYDHEAVREPTAAASGQGRAQSPAALSWNRLVKEPDRPGQRYSQHRITKRRTIRPGIDTKGGGQGTSSITFDPDTRNRRSVWSVATHPFPDAHFATFPPDLIRPCILAGCPVGGVVLDPFFGAGTVGVVCALGVGLVNTAVASSARAEDLIALVKMRCEQVQVPMVLTLAIAHQESGLDPWAVNVAGRTYRPGSRHKALQIIHAARAAGKSHDIGVMQINSQWLKRLNLSPEQVLEPSNNILVGVLILKNEIRRYGLTWKAVAAYHTPPDKNPQRGQQYAQAVIRGMKRLIGQ